MNSLSWLLYLADVSGKIGTGASVFGFITLIVYCLCHLFRRMAAAHEDDSSANALDMPRYLLVISCTLLAVSAITPDRQTIHLIAASEMSQMALESETAIRIGGKLEEALDKMLEAGR